MRPVCGFICTLQCEDTGTQHPLHSSVSCKSKSTHSSEFGLSVNHNLSRLSVTVCGDSAAHQYKTNENQNQTSTKTGGPWCVAWCVGVLWLSGIDLCPLIFVHAILLFLCSLFGLEALHSNLPLGKTLRLLGLVRPWVDGKCWSKEPLGPDWLPGFSQSAPYRHQCDGGVNEYLGFR